MTEIIVRYGCDGCGKLYENKEDLRIVEVKQWRGGRSEPVYYVGRVELLCPECWQGRQPDHYEPSLDATGDLMSW
jgi:hypothetical protein